MIAARIATTITHTIGSAPCEARTLHAINAVSPGTGSPNDSNSISPNIISSAHWLCASMKLVIDPRRVTVPG
jgi:hypothetical protein